MLFSVCDKANPIKDNICSPAASISAAVAIHVLSNSNLSFYCCRCFFQAVLSTLKQFLRSFSRILCHFKYTCPKLNLQASAHSLPCFDKKSKRMGGKRTGRIQRNVKRRVKVLATKTVNELRVGLGARPVGQFPVGIVGVPVPAGSLSIPSVEPRRVCSNLLETAAQPRPDLKGYSQLARHGQVCTAERKKGQEKATEEGGGDE